MDLNVAIKCMESMKENGTYRNERIGIMKRDVPTDVPTYRQGEVVLFKREFYPLDSQMCLGEYYGMEMKPTGKVTLQSPLSQAEIEKQRAKKSLITTFKTRSGVPAQCIEEIIF